MTEPAEKPAGEPDADAPTTDDLRRGLRALASAAQEYDDLYARTEALVAQIEPHLTGRRMKSHRPRKGGREYLITALRVESTLQVVALGYQIDARGRVGYSVHELGTVRPQDLLDD